MSARRVGANEATLAKLLTEANNLQSVHDVAAFLARRGVLVVNARTVPPHTWLTTDAWAHDSEDARVALRRLARGAS